MWNNLIIPVFRHDYTVFLFVARLLKCKRIQCMSYHRAEQHK
ncbi:hypothetical protein BACCAP_03680 [Pseudoflavonifractor capillosus ATCC 29799]|uniref:Uncharacterized protein n=1 Tax=Pseudoflavonifractor capillosus ATCC 29799 TaxID=411467 RepID=A6NZM8_9FIRM|nr:hypothetical protein BACCAP_03680 [Pseudoflavonifractor capillosus ATCC 29799]